MKLKHISLFLCLLFGLQKTIAQTTGTPTFFGESENSFTVGYYYELTKIEEASYLYTLLPLLNNKPYLGDVTWVSLNESAVTIDEEGNATIVGLSFDPVELQGTITVENNKTLTASVFLDLSPNGGFYNLTGGQIVVNKTTYEGIEQRIRFVLFPNGNTDESTFKVPSLYTISDETIATISNTGMLKGLKPGKVTITGTSSVDSSITASIEVTVLYLPDEDPPIIDINIVNDIENDIVKIQRDDANTIPSATAEDNKDGTIPVTITETETPFSGTTIGNYPIRYSAEDAAGNEAIIDLVLQVVDTVPPVISLKNTALEFDEIITAKQRENLSIPEVTAIDDNGETINVVITDEGFDPDVIGTYKITYTATDVSGNFDERYINLEVTIGNPPSITITGDYEDGAVITINQDQEFTIPEATAIDAMGNEVAVEIEGVISGDLIIFDVAVPGTYPIKYSTEDRFGLTTEKQIQIIVKDTIAPEITNAEEITYLQRILTNMPSVVTKIEATDNVGVVRYSLQERNSFRTDIRTHDVNWWIDFYDGTISISNDGTITATKPTNEDFTHKHQHYFFVKAIDADGNESDVAYLTLSHVDDEPPVIKIKERISDTYFTQIGYNDTGELYQELTKQENITKVGDTIFQVTSSIPNHTFDRYELVGADAASFTLSSTDNTTSITLTTPLDAETKSEYNFTLNTLAKLNPIDPATVFPSKFTVKISTPEELAPELPAIQTVLEDSPEVLPDPVTGEKILSVQNLMMANGLPTLQNVLGSAINDILTQNVLEYPIIKPAVENAKFLISKLPYALFITNKNNITTIFIKGQKGPVSIQIEFIVDENVNGAYWMMNIGSSKLGAGIQPSRDIHSSLAFLDHMEGNIVYTNTTINKSNFKCLTLVSDENLTAGIHFIAKGPVLPPPIGASAFTNPVVNVRVGVTEAGWTVPDLTVKMGFDAKFLGGFDKKIIDYLFEASDLAKKGILAAVKQITDLKQDIREAEVVFEQAKYPLWLAQNTLDRVTVPGLSYAESSLSYYKTSRDNSVRSLNEWKNKKLCGDVCIPWYYPPRICYKLGFIPYPCSAGHIGELCANGICIPHPKIVYKVPQYTASIVFFQTAITTQEAVIVGLRESLEVAKEPFKLTLTAAEEALEQAKRSLDVLELALIAAEEAAKVAEAGYGELGKIARLVLSKVRLAESSNASLETTLAVANSGTISGKLGFGFKFKGAPAVNKEFQFSFSDPAGSAVNFAKSIVE